MIISLKHKFAFIHIWKTAGSSLRTALEPYSDTTRWGVLASKMRLPDSFVSNPYHRRHPVHLTYKDLCGLLAEEELHQLFVFAVVRNPWDWHVSLYHYMQQNEQHYQVELANKFKSYGDYLKWRSSEEPIDQRHFLLGHAGEVSANHVARFEELHNFPKVLKEHCDISIDIPHLRKSKHADYREYYSEDWMIDCVQAMNGADINEFNYSFDAIT